MIGWIMWMLGIAAIGLQGAVNMFGNDGMRGGSVTHPETETTIEPGSEQKNTEEKKFCGQCGQPVSPEDIFCKHCGAKLK